MRAAGENFKKYTEKYHFFKGKYAFLAYILGKNRKIFGGAFGAAENFSIFFSDRLTDRGG